MNQQKPMNEEQIGAGWMEEILAWHNGPKTEDAEQWAMEAPLEIRFRSGWTSGNEGFSAEGGEMAILLTTGGPAVRILCGIENGEPTECRLQGQDWGTPWVDVQTTENERDALQSFASVFTPWIPEDVK